MADRFPLILNTNANQIQEIASGDSLDLTGTNIANAGIITAGNVVIGSATTDLIVNGDARVTGILTVGTDSITLNDSANTIKVGTALTLGHTQGLQFHTQNLHSAGFEVNQINASGIITATGADINGDLDVDGHTNLDNVNVAGVVTVTGAVNASHSSFGNLTATGLNISNTNATINFTDTNNNPDFTVTVDSGEFLLKLTNSTDVLKVNTDAHIDVLTNCDFASGIDVTGNITATGNVSIGGTLTYEDVTNIDSIGIITARSSIKLDADGSASSNFLSIGAHDDLKIFHQSNVDKIESSANGFHIRQINGGDLHIHAGANTGSANNRLVARAGGKAELYYAGALKLSTETGGVNITGVCTATTFVGNLTGTASKVNLTSNNDNSAFRVPFTSGNTGSVDLYSDNNSGMTYNPSTGLLYIAGTMEAGTFQGALNATTGSFSGDATFNGGAGAVTVPSGGDIRISNSGGWTGEHGGKIQHYLNFLYIQGGTSGIRLRHSDGNDRWVIDSNGHFVAGSDSTYDIGTTGVRVRNGYFDTLYGDGSNLTGISAPAITAISNPSNNRIITSEGGTTVNAEPTLTFDGNIMSLGASGANGAGLYINGGTINNPGGRDAKLYIDDQTDNDWAVYVNKPSNNYGIQMLMSNSASHAFYIIGGGAERFRITGSGDIAKCSNIYPSSNNTYDLGATGTRWRNIYTNDLNLSNEGGANDVDNTWGDYTIQEGESDLFLINNRSGKKYKFNLTEVS